MNPQIQRLLQEWRRIRNNMAAMNIPPFVKLGVLIGVAVLPFVAFAALQLDQEPDADPTPIAQEPVNLGQQVPLNFPFGNPEPVTPVETPEVVEMSPSPGPTATGTPTRTQCSNGRDDDRDGRVDLRDPGCSSSRDTSESPNPATPAPRPSASPSPPAPQPSAPPPSAPPPSPTPPVSSPTPSPTLAPSPVRTGPIPGAPECANQWDDDQDGLTDGDDPTCDPPIQSE